MQLAQKAACLWWASRTDERLYLCCGVLDGAQQDSGQHHVDLTSASKSLFLTKAVLFQGLVTRDILAHENAQLGNGSFDEEAQSLLRKLKTYSPNVSGWLLWKQVVLCLILWSSGTTMTQPHFTPPPLSAEHEEEGARPPAPSSGAAAPLVLVLENTLHSVLLPAELLCWLSKKGGRSQSGGQSGLWAALPCMQGPAWARSCS